MLCERDAQTSEFIVRAFAQEKYSQVADLINFEERLDNSLQRDLVKIEHVRMRVAHEGALQELVDTELIELKFIFDRGEWYSSLLIVSSEGHAR